jgi:MFS family permease
MVRRAAAGGARAAPIPFIASDRRMRARRARKTMTASHAEAHPRGWANIFILSAAQAMSQSGAAMVITVTALTGTYLAERPALATVPLAMQFVGTAMGTVPAALLMGRFGRRIGFSLGQAIGTLGALVATYAVLKDQFWLFGAGSMAIGVHNAFWQQLRFAAIETVEEHHRARAISYVLAGGIVAAVAGPWLAVQTRELFSPVLFAGCYTALAGLTLVTIVTLQGVRFAKPAPRADRNRGRPLGVIARQPVFITAAMAAALGYGAMTLVMTSTPLAVVACGLGFGNAAFVIQSHVLAMFVPSFFTGNLINRFGVQRIILAGVLLNVVTMAANISGVHLANFWLGLVAIGVGWNFMFIGGTTLLAESCRPEERPKVQALNEFLVFGTVASASLLSGSLYSTFGWAAVNAALVLPVGLILTALAVSMLRRVAANG